MPFTKEQLREYRERKKREGICISCLKSKVTGGIVCGFCVDRINKSRKARRLRYREQGLCTECSTPVMGDYARCAICQEDEWYRLRLRRDLDHG